MCNSNHEYSNFDTNLHCICQVSIINFTNSSKETVVKIEMRNIKNENRFDETTFFLVFFSFYEESYNKVINFSSRLSIIIIYKIFFLSYFFYATGTSFEKYLSFKVF